MSPALADGFFTTGAIWEALFLYISPKMYDKLTMKYEGGKICKVEVLFKYDLLPKLVDGGAW